VGGKYGLNSHCRICEKERARLDFAEKCADPIYKAKSNESRRLACAKRRQDPEIREKANERSRLANAKARQDPEIRKKFNQAGLDWAKNNPDKACAKDIARKAYRIEANPCHTSKPSADAWIAAEADKIAEMYYQASEHNLAVDHIDPLRPSETLPAWAKPLAEAAKKLPEYVGAHPKFRVRYGLVCGLHVSANLQLLSQSENSSKSNKFTPYRKTDGQLFRLSKDGIRWELQP
jgi:hypothetical protein